ncbi:hypothetical protein LDENG_00015030, partial [Lucifuga dentata]
ISSSPEHILPPDYFLSAQLNSRTAHPNNFTRYTASLPNINFIRCWVLEILVPQTDFCFYS